MNVGAYGNAPVILAMKQTTWYRHALLNRLQTLLLLVAMGGFLAFLGWLLWGREGMVLLPGFGALLVASQPLLPPALVMRLYGGRRIAPHQAPWLHELVRELSGRAGLAASPALYCVPGRLINAFAVGTGNRSAVAVTDGLLRALTVREIAGVLAHEVSHVRNNDIWTMNLADLFTRLTSFLSLAGQLLLLINLPLIMVAGIGVNWAAIALLVLAPNISALAQLALSRVREYEADLGAVRLTGDPEGLARALQKIESLQETAWEQLIFPGRRLPDPSLLRTHPRTEDRVRRLAELQSDETFPYAPLNIPVHAGPRRITLASCAPPASARPHRRPLVLSASRDYWFQPGPTCTTSKTETAEKKHRTHRTKGLPIATDRPISKTEVSR